MEQTFDTKSLPPAENPIQIQPTGHVSLSKSENVKLPIPLDGKETQIGSKDVYTHDTKWTSSYNQGPGWLNWIQGTVNSIGSKVTEKARTSMDTMITTLDPQMKQFINTGGDIDLIVASNKDVKITPMREAFQLVFGKANVSGVKNNATNAVAQPVGIESALKTAEERINKIRDSGSIHRQQPVVAIEGFVVELSPEIWFEMSLLLLDDPWHDIIVQLFTQAVPISNDIIKEMKDSTADDYEHKDCGFAFTTGEAVFKVLKIPHTNWHEQLSGVTRKQLLFQAGKSLAYVYRSKLPKNVI